MKRLIARLGSPTSVATTMLRGGSVSLSVIIIGAALGLATNFVLARLLGASGYGAYAIATGWALMLAIPATFGCDFVLLRFAPGYLAEGRHDLLRHLVGVAVGLVLALTLLGYAVLAVLSATVPGGVGIATGLSLGWLAMLSGATALIVVLSSLFRARKQIFLSQFYQQILRSLLVLGLVSLAARLGGLDAGSALAITALSTLAAVLALSAHLWLAVSRKPPFGGPAPGPGASAGERRVARRSWLDMALPSLLSASLQQLLMQSGVIVLGLVSTDEQAAYYSLASRLAMLVTFPLSALASITAPMIVEAWNTQDGDRMQKIATMSARLSVLGAMVPAFLFFVLGHSILGIFGPAFSAAWPALLALTMGALVAAFTGACANLLLMTGRQRLVGRLMLVGLACQLVVLLPLAHAWGATGAAIAVGATTAGLNMAMSRLVARHMRVDANACRLGRAGHTCP